MMARLPLSVTLMVLLLFGAATTFTTLAGLPAFNDRLQEENILGSNRLGPARSRYDQADYLSLIGMSFLRARFLPPGIPLIDGESGPTTPEVALARATRATALLARSIAQAPADADTWRQLAWALALSGEAEAARVVLGQSWALAPYNRQIGARRLALAQVLFNEDLPDDATGLPRRPSPTEERAIVRDLDTLQKLGSGTYRNYARNLSAILQ